jgi:hypothetical protein
VTKNFYLLAFVLLLAIIAPPARAEDPLSEAAGILYGVSSGVIPALQSENTLETAEITSNEKLTLQAGQDQTAIETGAISEGIAFNATATEQAIVNSNLQFANDQQVMQQAVISLMDTNKDNLQSSEIARGVYLNNVDFSLKMAAEKDNFNQKMATLAAQLKASGMWSGAAYFNNSFTGRTVSMGTPSVLGASLGANLGTVAGATTSAAATVIAHAAKEVNPSPSAAASSVLLGSLATTAPASPVLKSDATKFLSLGTAAGSSAVFHQTGALDSFVKAGNVARGFARSPASVGIGIPHSQFGNAQASASVLSTHGAAH